MSGGRVEADEIHRPEVWRAVAPGYDDWVTPIMPLRADNPQFVGPEPRHAGCRLLDVAAGTGVVAVEPARREAEILDRFRS
jgi:ubiquinone/menaquinone biosynthesis C-methylase UbiE